MSLGGHRSRPPSNLKPKTNLNSKSTESFQLKALSYNVNFGIFMDLNETSGAQAVANVILNEHCDLVALQETTPFWEKYFNSLVEMKKQYPYQIWEHDPGQWYAGGSAILSKFPIVESNFWEPLSGWFHGLHALIELPNKQGQIQIIDLHLRPPLNPHSSWNHAGDFFRSKSERLADLKHWMEIAEKKYGDKVATLMMGDTNEAKSGIFGGYITNYLESLNFEDAIESKFPTTDTWIWPLSWFTLRGRYDHIYYDKSRFSISDSKIVLETASDHRAVIATLNYFVGSGGNLKNEVDVKNDNENDKMEL